MLTNETGIKYALIIPMLNTSAVLSDTAGLESMNGTKKSNMVAKK